MENPILAKAQQNIEKSVPPDQQNAFDRIVVAGMKVLFSSKTNQKLIAGLEDSKDPVADIGKGAVGLILTLQKESQGTMPMRAMIPAGTVLMLHALDYIDKAGIVKIGNAELDKATEVFLDALMPAMGLTPEKTQSLMGSVQSVMSDPQKMQQYKGA